MVVVIFHDDLEFKDRPLTSMLCEHFIAFHLLKTSAFKCTIFQSSPLRGRPIRFDNMIHVKNLLEISSHKAKLMLSLADGKVKIAVAARNSFD